MQTIWLLAVVASTILIFYISLKIMDIRNSTSQSLSWQKMGFDRNDEIKHHMYQFYRYLTIIGLAVCLVFCAINELLT